MRKRNKEEPLSLETRAFLSILLDVLADELTEREQDKAMAETSLARLVATLGADAIREAMDTIRETARLYSRDPRLIERAITKRRKADAAGRTEL